MLKSGQTPTSVVVRISPYAGDSQYGAYSEFNPASSNVVTVTVAS